MSKADLGKDLTCKSCFHYQDEVCTNHLSTHFGHVIKYYHPACKQFND